MLVVDVIMIVVMIMIVVVVPVVVTVRPVRKSNRPFQMVTGRHQALLVEDSLQRG